MWKNFSNLFSGLFGGSTGNTSANGFGIQQSDVPTPDWFWKPTQDFGVQAMNSPKSSLVSGTTWNNNQYKKESPGWFSPDGAMVALDGLQSMFNWVQGNKALDLARDQFDFSKEMTQKNLANQTSLLNTAMQDRQNARRAASSSYQDTGSYMKEHGL